MLHNSIKPENLSIPPYLGSLSTINSATTLQKGQYAASPKHNLDPSNAYSSAPDLQQVVVVPREAQPRRNMSSLTQFRVGHPRARRHQTWPKHVDDKKEKGSFRAETRRGPNTHNSTPDLQDQTPAQETPPPSHHNNLRRRKTWPRHLANIQNRRHGLKHNKTPSQWNGFMTPSSTSNSFLYIPSVSGDLEPGLPGPNEDLEPLESLRRPRVTFDDATPFWESYNRMADFEDKEFVKAIGVNLDTHLIFAGLFSAVNTAFIIEALKTLQPDQAEKTNDLIRSVILVLHNSTFNESSLHDDTFKTATGAFGSAAVFFISLSFSLTAALGSVMGKQWLNYYEREGRLKPPPARGRERQQKYDARDRWHMEGVIETLPTLLQISLFLFLIALVNFLRPINVGLAYLVLSFSLIPVVFYIATTAIAMLYPLSPFQTRLSTSIPPLFEELCGWTKTHLVDRIDWLAHAWNFVLKGLLGWLPPLGSFCAIFLGAILLCVSLLFLAALSVFHCLLWSCHTVSQAIHPHTIAATCPTSTKIDLSVNPPLSGSDDAANLQCLHNYIQRASVPQDLQALLVAIGALPTRLPVGTDHTFVTSLVEFAIKRVLPVCYNSARTANAPPDTSLHFLSLMKVLHLAYANFGYGSHSNHGPRENKYLLNYDADRWIIQEVVGLLFRGPLDVDSASMVADVLSHSSFGITCSDANLATLYENLERPANNPQNYLPYISLLYHATSHGESIDEIRSKQLVHSLISSMWKGDKSRFEADLDYHRGKLRLKVLPPHLGDRNDECQFSRYLLLWREGRVADDSVPAQWFDGEYAKSIAKLLDTHPNSCCWAEQLEKDGHVPILLGLFTAQSGAWRTTRTDALYGFLALACSRGVTLPATSDLYFGPGAVDAVIHAWLVGVVLGNWIGRSTPHKMMEHAAIYLEEASRLQHLNGHDLTKYIEEYKETGNRYMRGDDRFRSLYERICKLNRTLVQPTPPAEEQKPQEVSCLVNC